MRLVSVAPNPAIDRLYDLDRFERDAVNRPRTEVRVAGGKGVNVGRAAALLGAEVTVVAPLAGHAGRWLAEALAGEGIAGRFAWIAGETRTCIAVHDASDDTLTELNEAGPTLDGPAWTATIDALRDELALGGVGLVTISGTLPPGAPDDGLVDLLRTAEAAGVSVAVDAGGAALVAALDRRPWLVKLNLAEASATLGRPVGRDAASVVDAARAIAAVTGGAVIVTRGVDGAIARSSDGIVLDVAAPAVRGPYPVGSGDAFLGGLAAATLRGEALPAALRLASAAAAANALMMGAGRLDPSAVARLAPAFRIEPVGR
jgi:1-phosphofructokinase family hexose kinase